MSTLPTIGSALHRIDPVAVAADNSGGTRRLGSKVWLDGEGQDVTLFIIEDATGDVVGGPYAEPHLDMTLHTAIAQEADTGPTVWRYVANSSGADIERGRVATFPAATPGVFSVEQAGVNEWPVGVAQFTLENGNAAWIQCGGMGYADCDGAHSAGDLLATAASGELTVTATQDDAVAVAMEAIGGAGISKVYFIEGSFY